MDYNSIGSLTCRSLTILKLVGGHVDNSFSSLFKWNGRSLLFIIRVEYLLVLKYFPYQHDFKAKEQWFFGHHCNLITFNFSHTMSVMVPNLYIEHQMNY